MKLLRIVTVAALTAFGGITGGTCIVHATPATGVLLGAPAVKTLQTPTMGALPLEKAYYSAVPRTLLAPRYELVLSRRRSRSVLRNPWT
jgi:hypothetical protein